MVEPIHSSLQESSKLPIYMSSEVKYYYLPLFTKGLVNPIVARQLGFYNDSPRTLDQIQDSLTKAKVAKCSHIKLPVDRWVPFLEKIIRLCEENGLPVILQICVSFLNDEDFFQTLLTQTKNFEIEWVMDSQSKLISSRIFEAQHHFKASHISVPIYKSMDWSLVYCPELFPFFQDIHLYFGYQLSPNSDFLNCKQAHFLLGLLRKKFPNLNFLPPKGVDLWDERVVPDFDMEPYLLPCFETKSSRPNIRFSVIIPSYNNQNHLRAVLRHLCYQNIGLDNFEVIVVDDGGTDQTQILVLELLSSFSKKMNFKYIYFPRDQQRTMGDSKYRAGISRNLGAKNAEGDIFCFLDSDIIVPETYLEKVGVALDKWDGVQGRRLNLSQKASRLNVQYKEIDKKQDIITDEPYWVEFLKLKEWHKQPYSWKYVCTHSFSIKRSLFWKLGGLKKNFIFYGFEDTDFGYRFVKRGYKLHLLDIEVFHMFHENTRSEFFNTKSLRDSLLSKTAQIFYLHHLDEDIYENLLGYMGPELTFQRALKGVARILSFQFIWGKKDLVYKSLSKYEAGPLEPDKASKMTQ